LEEVAAPEAWSRLAHPEDLPRLRALAAEALAGRPGRAEFRYRAKDGSDKVGFAMTQPRWQGGAVVGITTLILDLTRERRLERALQRAQAVELVGRLASGVAHDFNSLLTVILSLAELARDSLPADHPVQADLGRIRDAGAQASALAVQLLA